MKTKKTVSPVRFIASAIIIVLIATSCNMKDKPKPPVQFNEGKEQDAKFLISAAEINLEEIQLGQMAQTKSVMSDVKDLGKMMEAEHTAALKDLKILAVTKHVNLPETPSQDGQDAYNNLNNKNASEFDKTYCDMMVTGHTGVIEKFEKEAQDATDPDIRTWATNLLPILKIHLEHAVACQKARE